MHWRDERRCIRMSYLEFAHSLLLSHFRQLVVLGHCRQTWCLWTMMVLSGPPGMSRCLYLGTASQKILCSNKKTKTIATITDSITDKSVAYTRCKLITHLKRAIQCILITENLIIMSNTVKPAPINQSLSNSNGLSPVGGRGQETTCTKSFKFHTMAHRCSQGFKS